MSLAESYPPVELSHSFRALSDLVREWRRDGRKSTTAGLKPALQRAIEGFSETDLGFPTFRQFVEAAEAAGFVKIEKLSTGHSWVMLPGESGPVVEQEHRIAEATLPPGPGAAQAQRSSPPTPHVDRLKPDVWSSFVDWREGHVRYWDRTERRGFMYPVDPEGTPVWVNEPGRFAAVDQIEQGTQIGWMREWAETLPEQVRAAVVASLDVTRPLGAFRKEIAAAGLTADWRSELHRRVAEHVRGWAAEHGVLVSELIDQRAVPTAATPPPARHALGAARPARVVAPPHAGTTAAAVPADDASRLRVLLHRAVDRMSLAELLSIPVRAEHLLDL